MSGFYELISAVLTAQNMALIDWSKTLTTLNNVLLLNTRRQNVLASSG
jgi:hypothetical protein